MRTYRELFRTPEFTPLFLASAGHVAGQTVSGLALGTLVYESTDSPLLSALAVFGPSLAQVLGATTLLSAADRLPPRAALTGAALFFALCTAVQAVPGLPVWAAFALLLVFGFVSALAGGVRYGLLNEILTKDGYLLGRSVLNMSAGTMQICGYALGGVLVATLSARGALLAGAALYALGAAAARTGLSHRSPRATGRPSVRETWRNNALLWSSVPRRHVYLALWVPNGLIVGCESLYVSYAPEHAGLLFAATALGMLAGDTLTGRFVPRRWRLRLGAPLRLLLAVPFLIFTLHPPLPLALAAVTVAAVGFAASLLLQERLMELTPDELSGHALGLHSSGMLTMQGAGAALAGTAAQLTSPATAMTLMAAASVVVTLTLARGLRAVERAAAEAAGAAGEGADSRGRRPASAAEANADA
ncbi:MFS transporter [Streptomyces armeniacus]|uniref:MFS transporter n=1 Tax=Streptomyces armeniacus TaxID=83291 RepID=UPI001FEC3406|nr:MFS transporter [Streptomyces armeniacus]